MRELAREHEISTFSAAEIYNVLVAAGVLEARAGQGYFVPGSSHRVETERAAPVPADALWEHRRAAKGRVVVDAGCGWLPREWLYAEGIRRALRRVAQQSTLGGEGYGDPYGLAELRAHLAAQMHLRGIGVAEDQIILTQGASQGLDLIVRSCVPPGDTVIVEDPGYPPLFELLRARSIKLLSVPRRNDGPDVQALEQLLKSVLPRLLFTNTTCQNPTGTTTSAAVAHRILELADRYGFGIVEDDLFAEFASRAEPTLASLDQLSRVTRVSSLSKTIAPELRVGYVMAPRAITENLARTKLASSMASSELMERIALCVLNDGHHRRHLERLRRRLSAGQLAVTQALESRGVELPYKPQAGMFLWGKLPSREAVGKLWHRALQSGVLLAPGELFRSDGQASPFWRLNVAHCGSARLYEFIDAVRAA